MESSPLLVAQLMRLNSPVLALAGLAGEEEVDGARALSILEELDDRVALGVLEGVGLNGTSGEVMRRVKSDPALTWRRPDGAWGLQRPWREILYAELESRTELFGAAAKAAVHGLRIQIAQRSEAVDPRSPDVRRRRVQLIALLASLGDEAAVPEYEAFLTESALYLSSSDAVAAKWLHTLWPGALPLETAYQRFQDAMEHYQCGRLKQAYVSLESALEGATDPSLRLSILMWLGIIGRKLKVDFATTELRLREAVQLATHLEDEHIAAVCLTILGRVLVQEGKEGEAVDALLDAASIRRRHKDDRGLAMTLNALGRAFTESNRSQEAIDSLVESIQLGRRLGDRRHLAITLNALGRAYTEAGRADEAIDPLVESVEMMRQLHDRRGLAKNLNALGRGFTEAGRPGEAISPLAESLEILRRQGDLRGVAMTSLALGRARLESGDPEGALPLLRESVEINTEMGQSPFVRIARGFIQKAQDASR